MFWPWNEDTIATVSAVKWRHDCYYFGLERNTNLASTWKTISVANKGHFYSDSVENCYSNLHDTEMANLHEVWSHFVTNFTLILPFYMAKIDHSTVYLWIEIYSNFVPCNTVIFSIKLRLLPLILGETNVQIFQLEDPNLSLVTVQTNKRYQGVCFIHVWL